MPGFSMARPISQSSLALALILVMISATSVFSDYNLLFDWGESNLKEQQHRQQEQQHEQIDQGTYDILSKKMEAAVHRLDNLKLAYRQKEFTDEVFILEDRDFPKSPFVDYPGVGEVSGVTVLPSGEVALFHRSEREWKEDSFLDTDIVVDKSLIKNDTIMIIDGSTGVPVDSLGANLFVMPHSITSDHRGNIWVSDTGRHQVMRLATSAMMEARRDPEAPKQATNSTNVWPDLILGEPFIPGSDLDHFCKPTEIVVSPDGKLVFVADGYCNKRVLVFTGAGKLIGSFGDQLDMSVVHSLALLPERNLICVADRENGRILCFHAGLDGDLAGIGELRLKLDYPIGKVYALVALNSDHLLVSSCSDAISDNANSTTSESTKSRESNLATPKRFRCDLAALNPFERQIKQVWASSDLTTPHALACSPDGRYVFAVELSKSSHKKLYKFEIILRSKA